MLIPKRTAQSLWLLPMRDAVLFSSLSNNLAKVAYMRASIRGRQPYLVPAPLYMASSLKSFEHKRREDGRTKRQDKEEKTIC